MQVIIQDAVESDFSEIQKIYAYYVDNTTISLEETAPGKAELMSRWKASIDKSLPYLVAKINGKVAGYAYATSYRPRSAYRFTVEESVYIAADFHGQGIGRILLEEIITRCREKGFKQMLAVIAGADNQASINFHKKLGFEYAGNLKDFGYKFNKWVDTLLMQKAL